MRVFVAGASGVIGRPLIAQLTQAGHEVTGMTRSEERAGDLRSLGIDAVVCDVFDTEALNRVVAEARPEVVIHQLTALPAVLNPRKYDEYIAPTNRLREHGTPLLLDAASAAGARRVVAQSISFMYASEGDWVKDETARVVEDEGAVGSGVRATRAMERAVLGASDLTGVVLRYGQFYGPGTYYARDGSIAAQVSKRRFPIVGPGTGMSSFCHVQDAAGATVAALERGDGEIYNVCDDEPAPMREWLPVYAQALGAKPPRRVPAWLARLAAGPMASAFAVELRGASNAKAKRELGWTPRYPSWREGFRTALG